MNTKTVKMIDKLYEYKQLLKDSQPALLEWVKDKSNPLEERFKVWEDLVEKHHYKYFPWVPLDTAPPTVMEHFNENNNYRDRYERYDYSYFIPDIDEDDQELTLIKEWLIETNLKSYTYDW